jgi:hypothetical protein
MTPFAVDKAKALVKEAKKEWGRIGWSRLSEHQKQAEVALKYQSLVLGQVMITSQVLADLQAVGRSLNLIDWR